MGDAEADLSLIEGDQTIVTYPTLPDDGPTGGFYFQDQTILW